MQSLLHEMKLLRDHAETHMSPPAREVHITLIDRVVRSLKDLDDRASEGDPCGQPQCPSFGCARVDGCACKGVA